MADQSRYTVTLLNQQLVLVSDQTQDVVTSVCDKVDAIVHTIASKDPSASKASLALLAALQLAEELVLIEKAIQASIDRMPSVNQ